MREGVVADDVSGLDDSANNIGALADVASNLKKSCPHLMLYENFEQAQRVWVVGAVVVGERKLLYAARKAGKGASVPLAGGSHGLISGRQRSRYCRSSKHESSHRSNSNGSLEAVGVIDSSISTAPR